jgi:hypothetical protein
MMVNAVSFSQVAVAARPMRAGLIMGTQQRSISAITYMEYVPFCRNKHEQLVFEKILKTLQFKIHEDDHAISCHACQLVHQFALSHSMEMGDALINSRNRISP